MAGRGPQTFKKRQKEQQRKEKQQEKAAKREQRKSTDRPEGSGPEIDFDFSPHDDEVSAEEIADRLVGRTLADG